MWVHPDIVKSQQWTTVINRKSKGKAKASSNNVMGRETKEDVASFTSSGDEESAFAADTDAPPTSKTRSDKQYLKQYDEPMASQPRRQSSSPRTPVKK